MKTTHLLLLIIFLLVVWSLFHVSRTIWVANVPGSYILEATALYNGVIPSFIHTRFVYPLILAISFFIGGLSLASVHWVTQLIFSASVLITFYFSCWLYGRWVAFAASMFLCTSTTFMLSSMTIGPAFLFPSLILISCILFIECNLNNKPWLAIFSGAILGLAILTKENAWFYALYPFVTFALLKELRTRQFLTNTFIYFCCLSTVLYLGVSTLAPNLSGWELVGEFHPKMKTVNVGVHRTIWSFLEDIVFNGAISSFLGFSKWFLWFPIMFCGMLAIFWRGVVKGSRSDKIFLTVLIPIIPFVMAFGIFRGGFGFEFRHVIIFLLLSHVALGRLFQIIYQSSVGLFNLRMKKVNGSRWHLNKLYVSGIFIVFISVSVVAFGIVANRETYGIDRYVEHLKNADFGIKVIANGRFNDGVKQAADWISQNVPKGSRVGTGGMFDAAVTFFTNDMYEYVRNYPRRVDIRAASLNKLPQRDNDRIIEINTIFKFRSDIYRNRTAYGVFESDLNTFVTELLKEKQWIMKFNEEKLSFPYIDNLLSQSEYYNKVYDRDGVSIYETMPVNRMVFDWPVVMETQVTQGARHDLQWLRQNYPDEYKNIAAYLIDYNVELEN